MSQLEIVRIQFRQSKRYLLWDSGDERPSRYLAVGNPPHLLVESDLDVIRKEFGARPSERTTAHSLDENWRILRRLKSGSPLSSTVCNAVLDLWNLAEDLAISSNCVDEVTRANGEEQTRSVYRKIFAGCNLPAVTPKAKRYRPVLTLDELRDIGVAINEAWSCASLACRGLQALAPPR